MPRRNHTRKRSFIPRDPQAGRSHSHRRPSPPDLYEGERLARLAGRLAVLLATRGAASPTILEGPLPSHSPKPAAPPAPPSATPATPGDFCTRHPNGRPAGEPCSRCTRARRRAVRAAEEGVCHLHPDGDVGKPCSGCAAVRRRKIAEGVAVPWRVGGPNRV